MLDHKIRNIVANNRYVIMVIVATIGLIVQGYFIHLTTSKDRPRNLIIMEKSPVRIIARWDSTKADDTIEYSQFIFKERMEMYKVIENVPFKEYKFNENLYVRINTLDAKTDDANIKLDAKTVTSKAKVNKINNDITNRGYNE